MKRLRWLITYSSCENKRMPLYLFSWYFNDLKENAKDINQSRSQMVSFIKDCILRSTGLLAEKFDIFKHVFNNSFHHFVYFRSPGVALATE